VERTLLDSSRAAAEGGGLEMYVSTEVVAGVPLAISLVVTVLSAPASAGDTPMAELVRELGQDGSEVTLVELAAGRAVRRRRTDRPREIADLGAPDDSVLVDFFVPVPGHDALVLLSFSTPLLPLADALAEFFEAIAGTARWEPVPQ